MAACAPLLDEELSSFVFNYLTENSGSQYGEEEVCSDRLDFPDIDLSQLDPSDFDSDNCLNELQWCNDQSSGTSPTSIHYSTTDELFEIEEEHAALLAALTLDGMVDGEVGGLSVFPALEEEPKDVEEAGLALGGEDLSHSLGAHTEDLSLLRQLLLTPPNVPTGSDGHKDGFRTHRYNNRGSHLRPVRPLVKTDLPLERKPRAVRPAGRLCTELHRHLTTARNSGDTRTPETEEDEEEEEDEDSESEEDEEEEESSSSEVEAAAAPVEPPKPQFSSEKELHSVVELITYMHTYCLPTRKQQGWERKDREMQRQRARAETSRPASSNTRVVLVGGPGTSSAPRRLPFARRREQKADSLLCELLQQSSSYDVSKPYRLHSPPYAHPHSPSRLTPSAAKSTTAPSPSSPKPELRKDCSPKRRADSPEVFLEMPEDGGSFSVRRSRRLASFPSRFAKRLRPSRQRELEVKLREEGDERPLGVKVYPTHASGGTTTEALAEKLTSEDSATEKSCGHNEKRSCLCLPLNPKTTSEAQFSSKSFEQTLGVDLCGTAGLTPPTTPPHKSVEDELFKPAEGGKSSGGSGGDGGGDSILPSPNTASRSWLSRVQHQRKLPEQTELYAQLRRMGQAGDGETRRSFGDHDYCALSLGESRKRSAAILGAILKAQGGRERVGTPEPKPAADQVLVEETLEESVDPLAAPDVTELEEEETVIDEMLTDFQMLESTPPTSEEEAERSSGSRSPSPVDLCPDSPASKTDCSEHSEICSDDKPSNKDVLDEDDCQLLYIHNLPSSMTQNMLKKRFQVFGKAEDCKVIFCNEERCGVIKIRQSELQRHWRDREIFPASQRRLSRKRYIDLDDAGPGPVKSKYDALDFDTLLKEAQKSLHR